MEGVGARLGRSSSRYGTTTIFSGPVRKWKKDWVPLNPISSSSNSSNHLPSSSSSFLANGGSINGTNGSASHLRLFKWTPVSQSSGKENSNINNTSNSNDTADNNSPSKESAMEDAVSEEAPRRKFKYIPIALLEDQKMEAEENTDDEAKPADTDENIAIQASKSDDDAEKPDMNNVPMEENQAIEEESQIAPGRQDLNKTLDLSLGFTSDEEDNQADPKDSKRSLRSGDAGGFFS